MSAYAREMTRREQNAYNNLTRNATQMSLFDYANQPQKEEKEEPVRTGDDFTDALQTLRTCLQRDLAGEKAMLQRFLSNLDEMELIINNMERQEIDELSR